MIEISNGVENTPIKAVIYGAEGIGKSTLASKMPKAIFFDIECGTARLAVQRTRPISKPFEDFNEIMDDFTEVINRRKELGIETIVFDTVDALELLITKQVCKKYGKDGIESFGYSKGYTYVAEELKRFLEKCDAAIFAGLNVTLLAHAKITKFEQPDEMGAYDRWELKLSKRSAPLVKEWADLLLFCNYKTTVITSGEGPEKKKKVQGGERVMFTTHHSCWDAKNRFNLPDELPLSFDSIKGLYSAPRAEIDFGVPAGNLMGNENNKPFELGIEEPDPPMDMKAALKALMKNDKISEKKVLEALGGKYPKLDDIPDDYIENNLIAKWDRFKFFIQNGGKKS